MKEENSENEFSGDGGEGKEDESNVNEKYKSGDENYIENDKGEDMKLKGLLKRNAYLAKNLFIGNDLYAPYNYQLRVYDCNINEELKKIAESVNERNEEAEEEYGEINSHLKNLEMFHSDAIVSKEESETEKGKRNNKTHEEIYKQNVLNERKNKLRKDIMKNLTSIKMQIGVKETDEYSCVKKLHKLQMETEQLNEKKNKKNKKKKRRSILNSIINENVVDNDTVDIKGNVGVPNKMERNETSDMNGSKSNSVSVVKKEIKNASAETNIEAPIIKKQTEGSVVNSSSVLKDVNALDIYKKTRKPKWHYPYKLYRVILGHTGWVNCVDVDLSNEWFVTGSNDRLIKIWDLATCRLKLTLTGHINSIRDVKISKKNPYLFSCGEDNRVKCWDLEYNKVIRDYHGHLSGVYCLALHPTFDVLMSGGRDSVVRVWDIRTKTSIFVLSGHTGTIMSLAAQSIEPQIISGSQDKMIRLWDMNNGKCRIALTHHKKSIRSLAVHPFEYSFCSCAADNVKVWNGSDAEFDRNITGFNSIINCSLIKQDPYFNDSSILILGSNNGQLHFYDWSSGYKYDTLTNKVVPGTVESENSTLAMAFDKSESRLITTHGDKSIKIWKENEEATPENFPIKWNPYDHYKFKPTVL